MLVNIESPFAGRSPWRLIRAIQRYLNTRYARAALKDSLSRGEFPIASHLLYTQVLDDTEPKERILGITAGLTWNKYADLTVIYFDRGITPGMRQGIEAAKHWQRPVIYRSLYGATLNEALK